MEQFKEMAARWTASPESKAHLAAIAWKANNDAKIREKAVVGLRLALKAKVESDPHFMEHLRQMSLSVAEANKPKAKAQWAAVRESGCKSLKEWKAKVTGRPYEARKINEEARRAASARMKQRRAHPTFAARVSAGARSKNSRAKKKARAQSRWAAAKAVGCKTLAEYAALLRSQAQPDKV